MDEIVWIRPADYDPVVQPGTILCPEAGLPDFQVLARRLVLMMYNPGQSWDIRPFTELTLRIVQPAASRAPVDQPDQTMPVR